AIALWVQRASVRRYRANERDDECRDQEKERDREKRGEIEGRWTGRLRKDALERTDQRLGDPVETGNKRLVRVRAEELQDEPEQQEGLENREEERDDAGHRPHHVVARDGRQRPDVHVRFRGCRAVGAIN